MDKFFSSVCVGFVAFGFAKGVGIPVLTQWEPGGAAEIGVLSFLAAWYWPVEGLSRQAETPKNDSQPGVDGVG